MSRLGPRGDPHHRTKRGFSSEMFDSSSTDSASAMHERLPWRRAMEVVKHDVPGGGFETSWRLDSEWYSWWASSGAVVEGTLLSMVHPSCRGDSLVRYVCG